MQKCQYIAYWNLVTFFHFWGQKMPPLTPIFWKIYEIILKKIEIFSYIKLKLQKVKKYLHKFSNYINFYFKKPRRRNFFGGRKYPLPKFAQGIKLPYLAFYIRLVIKTSLFPNIHCSRELSGLHFINYTMPCL